MATGVSVYAITIKVRGSRLRRGWGLRAWPWGPRTCIP